MFFFKRIAIRKITLPQKVDKHCSHIPQHRCFTLNQFCSPLVPSKPLASIWHWQTWAISEIEIRPMCGFESGQVAQKPSFKQNKKHKLGKTIRCATICVVVCAPWLGCNPAECDQIKMEKSFAVRKKQQRRLATSSEVLCGQMVMAETPAPRFALALIGFCANFIKLKTIPAHNQGMWPDQRATVRKEYSTDRRGIV